MSICEYCGAEEMDHDYQHLARECYPQQIKELNDRIADAEKTLWKLNSGWELQDLMKLNNELRNQLAKCGKENCMGHEIEGHALWVRKERLDDALKQLEKASKELLRIQAMGATAPPNTLACQLGNIAHAARIELNLSDDHGAAK